MDENIVVTETFETYAQKAKDGLAVMFKYGAECLDIQLQSAYEHYMEEFISTHGETLKALANAVATAEDRDAYIADTAEYLTELEKTEEAGIKKRYKRNFRKSDTRMFLVMYLLPVMAEMDEENLKPVADKLVEIWPDRLGGVPMSYTSSAKIGAKFGGDWLKRLMGVFGGKRDK